MLLFHFSFQRCDPIRSGCHFNRFALVCFFYSLLSSTLHRFLCKWQGMFLLFVVSVVFIPFWLFFTTGFVFIARVLLDGPTKLGSARRCWSNSCRWRRRSPPTPPSQPVPPPEKKLSKKSPHPPSVPVPTSDTSQSNNNWPQQHTHASTRQHGTPHQNYTSDTPTNSRCNPSRTRDRSSSGNRLRECRNRRRHSRNARIL
mmetsp:Transcript_35993/g.64819  ORF Transcript_35993/g.64819 Transcript_35993/m.64819 type:complete len:200 (+) Transcript_35993:44-643(+)